MDKHIKITAKILLLALLFASLAGCISEGDEDFSLPRDKYIGSWFCQDSDGAGYYATISSDPTNSAQVIIKNYFNYKGTVQAIVTEGTIVVNNQEMVMPPNIQGTYHCEGNGSLTHKNGIYTIYWRLYAANDDETTSIYIKQ